MDSALSTSFGFASAPSSRLKPGSTRASRAVCAADCAALNRPTDPLSGPAPALALVEIGLHAILQLVGERDLGDHRVDCDLQPRPVELLQRPLDHDVIFLVGIDHDRVGRLVGGDAHVLEYAARQGCARPGLPPGPVVSWSSSLRSG